MSESSKGVLLAEIPVSPEQEIAIKARARTEFWSFLTILMFIRLASPPLMTGKNVGVVDIVSTAIAGIVAGVFYAYLLNQPRAVTWRWLLFPQRLRREARIAGLSRLKDLSFHLTELRSVERTPEGLVVQIQDGETYQLPEADVKSDVAVDELCSRLSALREG
jgi:hypothetical protein